MRGAYNENFTEKLSDNMLPSTLDTDHALSSSTSYDQRVFKYNNDSYEKNNMKSTSVMAKLLNSFEKNAPPQQVTPAPALKLVTDKSTPPEIHRVFIEINDQNFMKDSGAIAVTSLADQKKNSLRRQPAASNFEGYLRASLSPKKRMDACLMTQEEPQEKKRKSISIDTSVISNEYEFLDSKKSTQEDTRNPPEATTSFYHHPLKIEKI